jgi:hypothetical protein
VCYCSALLYAVPGHKVTHLQQCFYLKLHGIRHHDICMYVCMYVITVVHMKLHIHVHMNVHLFMVAIVVGGQYWIVINDSDH